MKQFYIIDLTEKNIEIQHFEQADVFSYMRRMKVERWQDLSNDLFQVFDDLKKAAAFLKKYLDAKNKMLKNTLKTRKKDKSPCLLLKRDLLLLTILGVKKKTHRKYKKDWKSGDKFYFHDQTYYVNCILTDIRQDGENYLYEFKLAK